MFSRPPTRWRAQGGLHRFTYTATLLQRQHSTFPFPCLHSSVLPLIASQLRALRTIKQRASLSKMITDAQLYSLAIFLGSAAMLLIVLYHFLEVNSEEHAELQKPKVAAKKVKA
ncbi:hypothetical protein B5807_09592 [Epicoccum nigrum]|uniref:Dolichyl-diphosphooligosaccharide--protein glycosyltransferase subunit 4 n=1 Tax=Epicoccum nigrum TaxID=105696 RepID=A0A1Y2LPW1_EPING|nr:hypothetical protein B5807_09592 [Epicoccum nigrum]